MPVRANLRTLRDDPVIVKRPSSTPGVHPFEDFLDRHPELKKKWSPSSAASNASAIETGEERLRGLPGIATSDNAFACIQVTIPLYGIFEISIKFKGSMGLGSTGSDGTRSLSLKLEVELGVIMTITKGFWIIPPVSLGMYLAGTAGISFVL